jgi:Flp pilus assembly protein TadG
MSRHGSPWLVDRRGIAAVEFALVAPLLLALLGGAVDFGLMMSGKSQLENGLAQGVQYAQLQGPGVSAAAIQSAVKNGSSRAGLTNLVTVAVTGPACYCVSGSPAALSTPSAPLSSPGLKCAGTCPGTGTAPGAYVIINTSYVYQPMMPLYSRITSTTVAGTATARLQ